ncbi:MAG TPA: serine/threonine-protein kinase, partial [Gaiellaceae bacterium]|nr:serine/threonine-protein kinase [Gaiellaceae bacterium]
EELVGSGGMSHVYKARDRLLERNVALKVLHPHFGDDEEYVERFRREARAAARLSHPNIVTVIDRGEADGNQFIVFEYIEGENLKELVQRTGALPVRRAIELGAAVADGLAFAHQHGLVHRDVKPQNVLLNGEGEAKVTDFGIARSLDVERGVTQTGTVMGTSNYISPEQANGKQVTPATDVYSLGVVLYELLTGEVPFPGDNFVSVAMKHVNDPPPSVLERRPDAPVRLAHVVDRALEKDPERRFGSMGELAAELRRCVNDLGTTDAEQTFIAPRSVLRARAPHRARARRPRWPLYALLALVAAAAIAAGVILLGGSKGKGAPGVVAGAAIPLQGVGSYDPVSDGGDGSEHNDAVAKATDGNPATFWTTDHYNSSSFGGLKPGVGLVLDAGKPLTAKTVTVTTDTPGFTAKIQTGSSASGPFADDSSVQTVNGTTTFALHATTARYYVVWLTSLPPGNVAHVNEVRAAG